MSYATDIESPERMLRNAEALIAAASTAVSKVLVHIDPSRQVPDVPSAKTEPVDPQTLAAIARRLIVERRVRDRQLNIPELFGEPAWDMLLDLYVAHLSGKQVSTSSACISSTAPATTGLRYIKALEDKNLVKRVRHQSDGRVVYICLTDEAVAQMSQLLARYANERLVPPRF